MQYYRTLLGGGPCAPCDPPNSGVHDCVDIRTGSGNPLALLQRARSEGASIREI